MERSCSCVSNTGTLASLVPRSVRPVVFWLRWLSLLARTHTRLSWMAARGRVALGPVQGIKKEDGSGSWARRHRMATSISSFPSQRPEAVMRRSRVAHATSAAAGPPAHCGRREHWAAAAPHMRESISRVSTHSAGRGRVGLDRRHRGSYPQGSRWGRGHRPSFFFLTRAP